MTWRLHAHAITRYRERINPQASEADAIRELLALCSRARYQRPANDGCEHWRVSGSGRKPGDRVRLVVERNGDEAIVRTVKPAHDQPGPVVRQIADHSYVIAPSDEVTIRELARTLGCSPSTARRRFRRLGLQGESGGKGARNPPTAAIDSLALEYRHAASIAAGAHRSGQRYTPEERALIESDLPAPAVARKLGRTVDAVVIARSRIVPPPATGEKRR